LLTLASRVADRSLASVEIVDLREDFQQTHKTSPISAALHAGIQECLANGTQALVLINRAVIRGSGALPKLRRFGAMRELQHLDDASQAAQPAGMSLLRIESRQFLKFVRECQSKYVYFFGEGSEHLEERLRKEFPAERESRGWTAIRRARRGSIRDARRVRRRGTDILVGTQMLAKGHDFQHVTLVGVVQRGFVAEHAGFSRGRAAGTSRDKMSESATRPSIRRAAAGARPLASAIETSAPPREKSGMLSDESALTTPTSVTC